MFHIRPESPAPLCPHFYVDASLVTDCMDADVQLDPWQQHIGDNSSHTHPWCLPIPDYALPIGSPPQRWSIPASNQAQHSDATGSVFAPFTSYLDFRFGLWAKMRGPSSTAVTELLKIPGVTDKLKLSYKTSQELNKIIDTCIPSIRPQFVRTQVEVGNRLYDFFFRDILECIRALFADPEFAPYLVFEPELHYSDEKKQTRLYHDMHTGRWWWDTQVW